MYPVRGIRFTTLFVCLLTLGGCGGGGPSLAVGGTSGSGAVGGTSGSGVAGGPVGSFGSVVVAGTRYLTDADDPVLDTTFVGPTGDFGEDDLAPGMLVRVNWQRDDDEPREALRIEYLPELVGPVTAALTAGAGSRPARMVIAGRTVELAAGSVFDDAYARGTAGVAPLAGPEALGDGDRLEVSGFVTERDAATGASLIRASRVARIGVADGSDPEESITGLVSDSAAGRFEIVDASGSRLQVSFDPAVVADGLVDVGGVIDEGRVVRVTGQLSGERIDGVSEIRRPLDDLRPLDDDDDVVEAEMEGPITSAIDDDRLLIAGQRVELDDDTTIVGGGSEADLTVGRRVRATGELVEDDDGERVLRATTLRVEPEPDVSLEDTVADPVSEAAADGSRTLRLGIGLTVLIRPDTVLKDDLDDSPSGRLDAADLAVGDFIEIDGFFDDQGRLVAVTLGRDEADGDGGEECELEARLKGSEVIGGERHYTIAGRPGLVIVDVGEDAEVEKIAPEAFGEFEADDEGSCSIRSSGTDIDGNPVDAGFLAGEVEAEDGVDD